MSKNKELTDPQCKVQVPFIYKGLHLALETVAVIFINIYDTKIWIVVHFYISLYP